MKLWILAVCLAVLPTLTLAGPIERACLQSDRAGASRALCTCIQGVADTSLRPNEQRRGAQFFSDPQRAQDTRQSNRASDERLWQRWRAFASLAEQRCG
jgi:hypothetical protein